MLFAMALPPGASFAQERLKSWSTKGNPEAAGHDFTIQYPSDYSTEHLPVEGYLEVFILPIGDEQSGNGLFMAAGIEGMPKGFTPGQLKRDGKWSLKMLDDFWQAIANNAGGAKNLAKSIAGDIPTCTMSTFLIGGGATVQGAVQYSLHGDKLVTLSCGRTTAGAHPALEEADYSKDPQCVSYFSSLQFLDPPQK
jgi:hypothetical protein